MHMEAYEKSSWLLKWLKLGAYIPSLNRGNGIGKIFMKRTNNVLQEK